MKTMTSKTGGMFTEFLNLSVPVMMRGGIQWLISTVELFWIGTLGGLEVAAAGVATTLLTFILSILRIPSVGAISVMSQSFAKGDSDTAHKQFKTAVIMSLIGGVIFSILVTISGVWMASFFAEGGMADRVGNYLVGFAWGLPAWGLMPLIQAGMVTANNAKLSLYAATGSAITFVILLAGGLTGMFDSMGYTVGLTGIGIMTSIANWVYVIMAFAFMNTKHANLRLDILMQTKVSSSDTKAIMATGVPGSLENIVTSVGLNFLLKGMSLAGPEVMHIASVGLRMLELVWLPFWYLSGAVTRFVAGKFSSRSEEKTLSALKVVTMMVVVPMCVISLFYLVMPDFMLKVVGRDSSVLNDQTTWVFVLIGFYQAVTVSIMSLSAILRGLTLFTYPMRVQMVSTLLICMPFLFLFQGSVSPATLVAFFVVVGAIQTYVLYWKGAKHVRKNCEKEIKPVKSMATGGVTT